MTSATATSIEAQECVPARWDDPARGTLSWRTLISGGLTPTAGLVCGVAEMQPGQTFAQHRHVEPEVYFGLDGEGRVIIDGVAHRLAPGVALYIPSMAEHGVPVVTKPLRWFYTFARDSFEQITYHFTHEDPAAGQRPE
ncbi:MAG: cupin domain-containing protein [Tabrizicola sp.]|uniref:cupin domain-containing protein n=1 Tax=Tabrizicola sp. TaxID=2005166 RepID=UPI0027352485|nr:cupin domain-containing protein [Tabrizicola sp.]MDP3263275.1 cupin domain-containing protein [Tabrizicola sp.]MDP3646632.1 cupin domain-containing protein [Paracoccaceae bacterium]MDZ4065760.1 cupin domain-containing protein [Tabrizicola sp.]